MVVRDQRPERRIEELVERLETLERMLHVERVRSLAAPQRVRLARTVSHSSYPAEAQATPALYGRFPIEFLDVGFEYSPGWWGPVPKTRKSPDEDYSTIALHMRPGEWVAPGTIVQAFKQEPIEQFDGDGEWMFLANETTLLRIGKITTPDPLPACSVGTIQIYEVVGTMCPPQATSETVQAINLCDYPLTSADTMKISRFANVDPLVVEPLQLTDCET